MQVEENAFILSQIATNFAEIQALGQLFECHFGKCKKFLIDGRRLRGSTKLI